MAPGVFRGVCVITCDGAVSSCRYVWCVQCSWESISPRLCGSSPGGYNDWCVIACFSDDEWSRLIGLMGSPAWATDKKYETLAGRLENQEEMDKGIEEWTKTLGKYEIMEVCQAAGVPGMPVQSNEDRVENDPQLRSREMYRDMEHPALGTWPLQNAPFKMSETPAFNSRAAPMMGEHNKEIVEGLLGISHDELVAGFEDGTFWPTRMAKFPYMEDMIDSNAQEPWQGYSPDRPVLNRSRSDGSNGGPKGAFSGLRVLELTDEKGQWCGKLMGDMGADVI